MLKIHQYRLHIIYKHGLDLIHHGMTLLKLHIETKDQKITGMNINVSTMNTSINMPVRRFIGSIQVVT